jgi:serine/threonine protein kinase
MHYCHIRGIVHRDLKLENVLFKAQGELHIKVVDFGIAGVCEN